MVAVDRGDRAMIARLRVAQQHGVERRSNAMVVAQVWRDRLGRQVGLAQLLRVVDVRAVSPQDGRQAGVLLGSPTPVIRSMPRSFCWPARVIASSRPILR